jgi:hypothetical protein
MANFKKNSIEPMVRAHSMLPVITKAMAAAVQVVVILQVVAFKMFHFLLSKG